MPKVDAQDFSWEVCPWRTAKLKGLLVISAILLVSFAVLAYAGPVLAAFATVILAGSVGPFYVTTRYRLTPDHVEVRSPFQRLVRPWSGFKQAHLGKGGVSLNPYSKRHFLESYRSVVLRFGDNSQTVMEWVSRYGPGENQS